MRQNKDGYHHCASFKKKKVDVTNASLYCSCYMCRGFKNNIAFEVYVSPEPGNGQLLATVTFPTPP